MRNIKIGDTITFTTITRYGKQKATRKVMAIEKGFGIGVFFNGWRYYWLNNKKLNKIVGVRKRNVVKIN